MENQTPSAQISFSLRPATEDDLPALVEIEKRVHVAPWSEASFRGEFEKPYSRTYLLTDDETDTQVAGYVIFWVMMETCDILNVVVDLPFRRQGMAKQMIRQVIRVAEREGAKRVILNVRKSNLTAIELYQGLNFSIVQIRKGFYSNGEDAYEMSFALQGADNTEF